MNGNYEEAKAIIESMPYVYNIDIYDRMRCSSYMLKGEDRLKGAREFKVWAHQDRFSCCEDEGLGFWEIGDYENAILSFEEVVNGIEVFAHREVPEEYTLLKHYVYQAVFLGILTSKSSIYYIIFKFRATFFFSLSERCA